MQASALQIITQTLIQRSGAIHMARIYGQNGIPITQATLAAIAAQVIDLDYNSVVYGPAALTISQVIFDSLQNSDPRWMQDNIGYNFLWVCPAQALSMSGENGQTDIKFTPVIGEVFVAPFTYQLSPVYIP